ncbi:MAG: T9SS type A sorting domain-containing protein [Bacteroidota bacterium]
MELKQNILRSTHSLPTAIWCCLTLLLITPVVLPAQTMQPGDANSNGLCSQVDVLYIGLTYGAQGPPRGNPSFQWNPPQQYTPWNLTTSDFVNYAHSDCDGNGTVDSLDVLAVEQNFGISNNPFINLDSVNNIAPPGAPSISLQFPVDTTVVSGTTTLITDLVLGTMANPVDSIHGIAFTLTYDWNIVDTVLVNLHGGWLTNPAGISLRRYWVEDSVGIIHGVITNTDNQNRAGYGSIGAIGIVMDDNIRLAGNYDLPIDITFVRTMTGSGNGVEIHPESTNLTVITTVANDPIEPEKVIIYPNPSTGSLRISAPHLSPGTVRLFRYSGQLVREFSAAPIHNRRLDLDRVLAGVYLLEFETARGILRKKLLLLP